MTLVELVLVHCHHSPTFVSIEKSSCDHKQRAAARILNYAKVVSSIASPAARSGAAEVAPDMGTTAATIVGAVTAVAECAPTEKLAAGRARKVVCAVVATSDGALMV